MAALMGIVFTQSTQAGEYTGVAYRSTNKDGTGRYTNGFTQIEGPYYEEDLPPAGSGVCCKGIHVGSIKTAWTYFGTDPECQLWKVTFKREDLLDCDGEKARIRGGIFEKIDNPFI